jgi:hypothetical protein
MKMKESDMVRLTEVVKKSCTKAVMKTSHNKFLMATGDFHRLYKTSAERHENLLKVNALSELFKRLFILHVPCILS